ncbi:hypothetical protein [Yoonia sp. R2-816]|uniref:hypothetical protein n=1 Tax=Yoonia sp. R2-816 TaxID=3342638 RepID=UPI0037297D1A
MIEMIDTTWLIRTPKGPKALLNRQSAWFDSRERVGILAAAGTGKSSLARLLAGIEPPDSGSVRSSGRVSWPIAYAGTLHPELTGAQNIKIIAQLIGEDPVEMLAFCEEFTGANLPIARKLKFFAPAQRLALSFSASMAVQCDHYIADEVVGYGDGTTRAKCTAILEERLEKAGLIYISRNAAQLKKLCTRFLVLTQGHLIECPSSEIAAAVLENATGTDRDDKLLDQEEIGDVYV